MTVRCLSRSLPVVVVALAFVAGSGLVADEPVSTGAVPLFNGKDLRGWVQRGGKAKYRVEGGEIIGTTVPNTANSFLCTERDYGNFILELEFKVQDGLNSGVQVRSQRFDEPKAIEAAGK